MKNQTNLSLFVNLLMMTLFIVAAIAYLNPPGHAEQVANIEQQ